MSARIIPELFAHQRAGVDFLLARGGSGALFWEMGLGKTRGALELFTHLRAQTLNLRMFVVAPLALLAHWKLVIWARLNVVAAPNPRWTKLLKSSVPVVQAPVALNVAPK